MRVAKDRVVAIDYTIRLKDGRVIESSVSEEDARPLVYMHGRSQLVAGVEKAIDGQETGAVLEIVVPPVDAYGERDPAGVLLVPRTAFPEGEELAPGMAFSATRSDGKTLTFQVLEVGDDSVIIDTNHPLAGETLHVSVAVRAVREATSEEVITGQAAEEAPAELPS